MDSVRLAVGETCGLVVELQRVSSPDEKVSVTFDDSDGLVVDVRGSTSFEPANGERAISLLSEAVEPSADGLPVGAALAVVTELVPSLDVATSPDGIRLVLSWSAEAGADG